MVKLRDVSTVSHVCAVDAFRDIFDHGLLTADQLLRAYGLSEDDRLRLTKAPRPAFEYLPATVERGPARLAHNKPLLAATGTAQQNLRDSLRASNTTLERFCELLNRRVYFWASLEFENGNVKGARRGYITEVAGEGPYDVIRVPFTALKRLAAEQGRRVELTELNAGSAPRVGTSRRGADTWRPLSDYAPTDQVQEVTIIDGVHGLGSVATQVIRVDNGRATSVWRGGPWR